MLRRLLALVAIVSCTVEREPARGDGVRSVDTPTRPSSTESPHQGSGAKMAETAPEDPRAQLDAIVRPEAKAVDVAPLPDRPRPKARREAGITLLEPGTEPRAAARLAPAPSSEQRLALHLGMEVAMHLGKQAIPAQTVPGIDVDLELKVGEPAKNGATRYRVRVADVRVQPIEGGSGRVREAVTKAAEQLAKIEGDAVLGAEGVAATPLDLELTDDNGLQPTFTGFRDAYAHLFVLLPGEPIGPGARWEVVSHGDVSGLPVQRVATYTLRERDGDRLKLDVAITEHATTPADGDPPAEPTGPVRPLSYTATGEGDVELDLSRVAPPAGSITSESSTRVEAAFGGTPTDVLMELTVKATISED